MRREPDAAVIERVRGGSIDAAVELFRRYWPTAWRVAYAVTGDRELADDAAQDAVVRAFASLERFDETRPFAPWLKKIAVNQAFEELRRAKRRAVVHGRFQELWAAAPGDEARDVEAAVTSAVAGLELGRRTVVVLHYWLGHTHEEIAALLDVPVGTVASRLSRALGELRASLEEDPDRVG